MAEGDRKRRKASNTLGNPIKFASKLLAVTASHSSNASTATALIAEAGGTVSTVDIVSGKSQRIGTGAKAPITSLVSVSGQTSTNADVSQYVFAGGWDKTITRFDLSRQEDATASASAQQSFKAHADFVKCLLIARTPDKQLILLSGGADGDVNIWTFEGRRLVSLKPQSRGIECLALDPLSTPEAPRVFFATSQREIYSLVLPQLAEINLSLQLSLPIIQHETSVYKIEFDDDGDMWTASADKTAKRLVRDNNFVADTTLVHPDFVRDIVVSSQAGLAVTACRDEEIRVWNTGTGQLVHIFTGHFEEVTGLALFGSVLVSVSIDATLRRWSLAPQDLNKAIEEAKNPNLLDQAPEPKDNFGGLTEEEEAQLRALMEEEEADALEKMAVDEQ